MKPPADFQWRDYYCLCVVFPQPSANRWEDDNGWRVGRFRKDGGWKNRGRLGCLKNPVFQILSAHKPPAQYVRHNAFLMLHLSAVCLSVFPWSSSARCLSSFGKHRNAAWVKSLKKTVGDKLQSDSTGWNIYLLCSARHATQLCLGPPFPFVYGCMLPDVIEVKCLCLRVQQHHLGFHPENLLFIEPPPICRIIEKRIKVLPYLSLLLCSFLGP